MLYCLLLTSLQQLLLLNLARLSAVIEDLQAIPIASRCLDFLLPSVMRLVPFLFYSRWVAGRTYLSY
jgi:hypothetical protein